MSTPPDGWQAPKMNWNSGNNPNPTDFNRIEGNPNAIENGNRTLDDSQVPGSDEGTLREILDWMCNRIKEITGETNWYDNPSKTLQQLKLIDDLDDIGDGSQYGRVLKSALNSGLPKLDACVNGNNRKVISDCVDGDGMIRMITADCQFKEAITRHYAVPLVGWSSGGVNHFGHSLVIDDGKTAQLPVALPHQAIVTRFNIWINGSLGTGHIKLNRADHLGTVGVQTMASLIDTGYTDSISYAQIDNDAYHYYVFVVNGSGSTRIVKGILISYTVILPRP